MCSHRETIALNLIGDALNTLRDKYSRPGDAKNRRDQIKAFVSLTFAQVEKLTDISGADGDNIAFITPALLQDIDTAFLDQIEREDAATPRTRSYSTLNNRTQGTGRAHVEAVR